MPACEYPQLSMSSNWFNPHHNRMRLGLCLLYRWGNWDREVSDNARNWTQAVWFQGLWAESPHLLPFCAKHAVGLMMWPRWILPKPQVKVNTCLVQRGKLSLRRTKSLVQNLHRRGLLTFIISKLQIMVHGCHKLLHWVASYNWSEVLFALEFAFQNFYVMIWKNR